MTTFDGAGQRTSREARVGEYRRGSRLRTTPAGTWFPAVGPSNEPAGLLLVHPGVDTKVLLSTLRRLVELDLPGVLPTHTQLTNQAGRNWLVTEASPAPALSEVVDDGAHRRPGNAAALLSDLAATLVALHQGGLVHGRLTAASVVLGAGGTALITDWGTNPAATRSDDIAAWTQLARLLAERWCAEAPEAAAALARAVGATVGNGLAAGYDQLRDLAGSARRDLLAQVAADRVAGLGKARPVRKRPAPPPLPPELEELEETPAPVQRQPPAEPEPVPAPPTPEPAPPVADVPAADVPVADVTVALAPEPEPPDSDESRTIGLSSQPARPEQRVRPQQPPPLAPPQPQAPPQAQPSARTSRIDPLQQPMWPPPPPAATPEQQPSLPRWAQPQRQFPPPSEQPEQSWFEPAPQPPREPERREQPERRSGGTETGRPARDGSPLRMILIGVLVVALAIVSALLYLRIEHTNNGPDLRIEAVTAQGERRGALCMIYASLITNGQAGTLTYRWIGDQNAGPVMSVSVAEGQNQLVIGEQWLRDNSNPNPSISIQLLSPNPKTASTQPASDCQ
jgi:hypothetical protein